MPVDATQPVRLGSIEQRLGLSQELVGILGDLDQTGVAIGAHHVSDRGRYHWNAGGQELRGFRGADVAGCLVQRERHYPYIPSGKVARQMEISLPAKPMNVWAAGQPSGIDLPPRSDHHQLPVGTPSSHSVDERK